MFFSSYSFVQLWAVEAVLGLLSASPKLERPENCCVYSPLKPPTLKPGTGRRGRRRRVKASGHPASGALYPKGGLLEAKNKHSKPWVGV